MFFSVRINFFESVKGKYYRLIYINLVMSIDATPHTEQELSLLILGVLDECLHEMEYPKDYLSKTKFYLM